MRGRQKSTNQKTGNQNEDNKRSRPGNSGSLTRLILQNFSNFRRVKIFKILKNHKLEHYSKESGLVTGADSIFQH